MTPKEQEIAINELEDRVDRLRNIYEQYFLGFEKLEPTVPRKDVDRRFALLRKEQIRNTAMRFRFNVIWQKYNTYSMHWIRICRQIEEGTYKRHVRKAKARFGDAAPHVAERDVSIDVDIGDFEDVDMDEVLAEATAAAETYQRDAVDTLPPPAAPSPQIPMRGVQARPMLIATPRVPFAPAGPMASPRDDQAEPRTPPPATGIRAAPDRAARGAPLPAGSKPRVLLRKREEMEAPPPSQRNMPQALPHAPVPPGPAPAPSARRAPEPSAPAMGAPRGAPGMRPPAQSSPTFATGVGSPRPSGPRIAPAAPSSAGATSPAAPGAGRAPAPAPVAQGAPAGGRVPAPAPSAGRPAPSAGRLPVAAPLPPPSAARLGGPPQGRPNIPGAAGSSPHALPAPRPQPQGMPAARAPMPNISDKDDTKDTIPPPAPSSAGRSRPPPPLPSQLKRPKE